MTPEITHWLTAAASLLAVLGLVLLGGRLLRAGGFAPAARAGTRVGVQESVALDPRRRLVLVRCDGREVLLLTGGTQDQVVGWLPERAA
ncbi:flagellar biosynthetic protein FliO [Roseomonas rosulenta]|uniref:flagellar biosynthetic protein FliO n=1 Tax=Roseomonas rosulenta TaxID=2748667 RepID=UPI0018DF3D03|nr:flagellar biosynthetic protein FliO [Roseomonas rosulenta]